MKAIIILSLFLTGTTWAGPSTSGGGFAVVCRDGEGKIKSAELLDLYEAKSLGIELMKSSGDEVRDYIRAASNGYRLQGYNPPISEPEMAENVKKFYQIVQWLPNDQKLPNFNDFTTSVKLPARCKFEPLAVFYDQQKVVVIDKNIWSILDSQNKSALMFHEIAYHLFRQLIVNPDVNSNEARLLTASFFSVNLTPVKAGIPSNIKPEFVWGKCYHPNSNSTSCTEGTEFYKLPQSLNGADKNSLKMRFTHLAGRPLLSFTELTIPSSAQFGSTFPIVGQQMVDWTAQIVKGTSQNGAPPQLLVRRGSQLMVTIPL